MASILQIITDRIPVNSTVEAISQTICANFSLKNVSPSSAGAALLAYVILCSALRRRRVRRMTRKLKFPDRKSLSKMTNVEAQHILQEMAEWEFPTLFLKSLQFALFKVGVILRY